MPIPLASLAQPRQAMEIAHLRVMVTELRSPKAGISTYLFLVRAGQCRLELHAGGAAA